MKEIIEYLATLSPETLHLVINRMHAGKKATALNGGCGQEPVGGGSTPYGYWSCEGSTWVWIPEF